MNFKRNIKNTLFKFSKNIALNVNVLLKPLGIKLIRIEKRHSEFPVEATKRDIEIIKYVLNSNWDKKLSMVSVDRLMAVISSTKYIIENNIEGDFVECGVWRGGCALAMAMILNDYKVNRKIYLYDTFEGMTSPGKEDLGFDGSQPLKIFKEYQKENHNEWCFASIEDVQHQFKKLNLNSNVIFVKGDVVKTLSEKENLPEKIALLRLDTDWYESTKMEMNVLYPKLIKNGVLLIDDYADWQGCKRAIDEYFNENFRFNYSLMWGNRNTGKGLVKR